jgi:hypothetical protein
MLRRCKKVIVHGYAIFSYGHFQNLGILFPFLPSLHDFCCQGEQGPITTKFNGFAVLPYFLKFIAGKKSILIISLLTKTMVGGKLMQVKNESSSKVVISTLVNGEFISQENEYAVNLFTTPMWERTPMVKWSHTEWKST